MAAITKGQIKIIHVLKKAIGMEDEVYRGGLYVAFGVRSSKDLTVEQAAGVIQNLQARAGQAGISQIRTIDSSRREGFATEAQLLYINGLWNKVSRAPEGKARDAAFRSFLLRVAQVSDMRFLTVGAAAKVINALKNMQARKTEREMREEAAEFAGNMKRVETPDDESPDSHGNRVINFAKSALSKRAANHKQI